MEEDDGDSSDCHSTVSSSEPLLDIPLPDQPFSRSKSPSDADLTGIPLPGSSPARRIQSTLFFDEDMSDIPPLPPLPPESSGKKEAKSSGAGKGKQRDGSGVENKRSSKPGGAAERCLEYLRDDAEEGALQTNTSLGLITLHVNKKLVPRLSRASVFDLNDENAKEIGRKLLRLKKLKKLRKMEEVAEHKIEAKERISMWKEELLGNGGLSLQPNAIATSLAIGSLPQPEKKAEEPHSERVDTVTQNPTTAGLPLPAKLETPPDDGTLKSGTNESLIKDPKKPNQKPLTFVKVQSKDEKKEYNWPVEMILSTKLSPKICYSCNPLEFDFNLSNMPKDSGKVVEEEAKNKDRKKKKSRGGSSHKRNSHSSQSTEAQRKEDSQKTGSGSVPRSEGGGGSATRDACKKPGTETSSSNPSHAVQSKEHDESKNGQKRKSGQSSDRKKTSKDESTSKVHDATTQKGKGPGTDSKDAKKTPSTKEHAKGSRASEERNRKDQKVDTDTQRTRDLTLQKDSAKDGGRKRKLSAGDSKQPTKKKMNVQQVSKSVEVAQIGSGRVSDFEDVGVGTGAGKWDTSSDSEVDLPGPSKPPTNRTSAKVEVSRRNDHRQRRSRTSSDRDTSSSRERRSNDSDDDSQRSRSRSRSYSSRSYYSSDRSCSYSSDSDYHRRHSRSSTRSRSHCRRSSSYSDRSYRSKSRSYARSRRSRSRSGSRGRFRSYSTYSRSSRSYSRSRSRSKSRSYRRYSRSFDKRRSYDRRLGRADSNQVHTRNTKQERKQDTKSKGDVHNTKNRKSDEHLSSSTKLSSLSKSGQSKEISDVDVSAKASSAVGETTVSKTNEKNEKVANDDKSGKVNETLQSEVNNKPESNGKDTLSIPLPSSNKTEKSEEDESPNAALSFIGPTLPVNHPLAHVQDIPVPKNEQFQPIGPNDPLVFKTPLLPPPPPPSFLTEPGSKVVGREPPLPPKPRSPPPLPNDWSTMEDIIGDEEPIPHMLDMGSMKPAMIIPPEQADQYRALQQQAQQHARQRMRQEAGIDDEEEEEEPPPDDDQLQQQQQQQLIDEMMREQAQNASFLAAATAQPMIHIPQQQLIGSAPGHQVVVGSGGFFQVPMTMQMMSTGHPHGLMTLAPSMVLPQSGAPMVIAAQQSGAMSALIRAHEAHAQAQAQAQAQAEAAEEAEAQAKAQASIFQAHPHHELVQFVQMPGGRVVAIQAGSSLQHAIAVSGMRSAPTSALHQVHPHGMIPVHAVNHPSLHQQPTFVQSIPFGLQMRVGMTPSVVNTPQVLAGHAQQQGMPLLIDSSGNILVPRLLRQGHL